MVKRKTKKSSKLNKGSGSAEYWKWLVVTPRSIKVYILIVVIIAFGAWLGVNRYQIYQEKQDLLTKQSQLNELADKIVADYKPDERTSRQYCDYSNQKYKKGNLSCGVDVDLGYKNVDL